MAKLSPPPIFMLRTFFVEFTMQLQKNTNAQCFNPGFSWLNVFNSEHHDTAARAHHIFKIPLQNWIFNFRLDFQLNNKSAYVVHIFDINMQCNAIHIDFCPIFFLSLVLELFHFRYGSQKIKQSNIFLCGMSAAGQRWKKARNSMHFSQFSSLKVFAWVFLRFKIIVSWSQFRLWCCCFGYYIWEFQSRAQWEKRSSQTKLKDLLCSVTGSIYECNSRQHQSNPIYITCQSPTHRAFGRRSIRTILSVPLSVGERLMNTIIVIYSCSLSLNRMDFFTLVR